MIISNNKINVKASGSFESTEFRIDAKYKNKVLWMLINQYRHKVRTPVQEIISNARDAQRENGNPDRPIKIQLPTRLESTFIVRDYGVGMDEERIKTIFTSFGASTKSSSNEQTGGFGIGAKSPLAYTDSFNIKTYIDGKYWFYVIAKTTNDGIGLTLLDSGETTEENGTEVQIPVNPRDVRDFVRSSCRCTMFWDVQPEYNLEPEELYRVNPDYGDVLKISDNLTVYKKQNLGNLFDSKIVLAVDGIPYEVDYHTIENNKKMRELEGLFNYSTNAVIKLKTGDIDLLQTRESIDETERTTKQLTKFAFKAYSESKQYIDSHLNEVCLIARYKQYKQLNKAFNNIPAIDYSIFKLRSGGIELPTGLSIYYYDYKGRSRGFVKNPQKHYKTYGNEVSLDDIQYLYWDNLKDESPNRKARRLRYQLENLADSLKSKKVTVMVIDQGSASKFEYVRTVRMLKAVKLSDLPFPPKSVKTKSATGSKARKLDQGKIILNELKHDTYSNSIKRASKDVDLSTVTDKYIYDDYSQYDKRLLNKSWFNLMKQLGYKVALVSKKYAKNVNASKNFTYAKTFFDNFKVCNKIRDNYIQQKIEWDYYSRGHSLRKNGFYKRCKLFVDNNISDPVLLLMSNILNVGHKERRNYYTYALINYPKEVQEELDKDTKLNDRITRLKILKQKFNERLEEKYPMFKYIANKKLDHCSEQFNQEFVEYINTTYRSRLCK